MELVIAVGGFLPICFNYTFILTDNRASINVNSEQFKHDLLKDEMKKKQIST